MSPTITIEVPTGSQTARVTVPLSAIGADSADKKANAAAISQFTAQVIKDNNAASDADQDQNDDDVDSDDDDNSSDVDSEIDEQIEVLIQPAGGGDFSVTPFTRDKVETLKYEIYDRTDVPPDQQQLVFRGTNMADEKRLDWYGVRNKGIVHLVIALRPRV